MNIEYKSLFLGLFLGIASVFTVLFILGNVETEISFATGHGNKDKNIEVSIKQIIENGENFTNVLIKGTGDVTRDELEVEMERLLEEQGIDKNKTKLNVEIEIQR